MKQATQAISISYNVLLVYWINIWSKQRYHLALRLLSPRTVIWHEQTNEKIFRNIIKLSFVNYLFFFKERTNHNMYLSIWFQVMYWEYYIFSGRYFFSSVKKRKLSNNKNCSYLCGIHVAWNKRFCEVYFK